MADTGLGTSITFSGRVLHYTCDDTVTTDISGNSNIGTLTGSGATLSTGLINNKLTFNGSGYIEFTSVTLLGLAAANSAISVSCWVKTTQDATILSLRDSSGNAIFNFTINTGKLSINVRDNAGAGSTSFSGTTAINDGNWHHVVVTRSTGKLLTLYVDGASSASASDSLTNPLTPDVSTSAIGYEQYVGGLGLTGSLDDFQVYNRALTATEITSIYNGGFGLIVYNLPAALGTFVFTKISANTVCSRTLPSVTGTFTVTGIAAGGAQTHVYVLPAVTGTFTVTGIAAGSASTYILSAAPAALLLTGLPIGLTKTGSYALVANTGAFVLTGSDAGSVSSHVMSATSGNFVTTGLASSSFSSRAIVTTPAAFLLTGIPVGLSKTGAYALVADNGAFALTGQPINLVYTPSPNKTMFVTRGLFAWSSSPTNLNVERIFIPPPGALNFGRRVWVRHW